MNAEGSFSDIEAIYDWWDNPDRSLCDYDNWLDSCMATEPTTWGKIKAEFGE